MTAHPSRPGLIAALERAKTFLKTAPDNEVEAYVDTDWPSEPEWVLIDGRVNLAALLRAALAEEPKP